MVDTVHPILYLLLTALVIALLKNLRKNSKERSLRDLVFWCVSEDSKIYRCGLSLRDYIKNAQIKEELPQKYRLSGDTEWNFAEDILREFQHDMTQKYVQGCIEEINSKYVIPGDHYFMFSLDRFLEKHQCDSKFYGHEMHKETVSYKHYGDWGAQLFDATYSLTEFSVVYHKMYYLSHIFCKNSKVINKNGGSYRFEDDIKRILDTKQIHISRS